MRATITEKLLSKLRRKAFRDEYVAQDVRLGLAYQIKALRNQRGWSQRELADRMGTTQSVVSRLEDPDYGRVSLKTALDVASACDVAFTARYCSYSEMLFRSKDVSPAALEVTSFSTDQICAVAEVKILGRSAQVTSTRPPEYQFLTSMRAGAVA